MMLRAAPLLLCAAYMQGGLNKLLDFPGAVGEARHFGLPLPAVTAVMTIALELLGSAAVVLGGGWLRQAGALALAAFTLAASFIANRFWDLPTGPDRFMTANALFEHVGLVVGLLLVALITPRPVA